MDTDTGCISEREFADVWGVYLKPSGDLFEFEDVRGQPENHVWTAGNPATTATAF